MDYNNCQEGKPGNYMYGNFTWTIELNRDLYWCYQKSCQYSVDGCKKRFRAYWVEIHPELEYLTIEQLCKQVKFIEQKRICDSNYNDPYHSTEGESVAGKTKYDLVKEKFRRGNNEWTSFAHSSDNSKGNDLNVLPGQQPVTTYLSNTFRSSGYPGQRENVNDSNFYSQTQVFSNSASIPSHTRNEDLEHSSVSNNTGEVIADESKKSNDSQAIVSVNEPKTVQIEVEDSIEQAEELSEEDIELISVDAKKKSESEVDLVLSGEIQSSDKAEVSENVYESKESVSKETIHDLRSRKINFSANDTMKNDDSEDDSEEENEENVNNNDNESEYEIEEEGEEEEEEVGNDDGDDEEEEEDDDNDLDYIIKTKSGRTIAATDRKTAATKTQGSIRSEILEYKTDEEDENSSDSTKVETNTVDVSSSIVIEDGGDEEVDEYEDICDDEEDKELRNGRDEDDSDDSGDPDFVVDMKSEHNVEQTNKLISNSEDDISSYKLYATEEYETYSSSECNTTEFVVENGSSVEIKMIDQPVDQRDVDLIDTLYNNPIVVSDEQLFCNDAQEKCIELNRVAHNVELSQTLSIVVQNVTEDELKDVDVVNKKETLLAPIIVIDDEENDEELVQINLNKRKYIEEEEEINDLPCMSTSPPDKIIKLDTKDDLRDELQKLLIQEEKNMVTLTEKIEKTTITFNKDVEEIEEEKLVYDMEGKVIDKESNGDSEEGVDLEETKTVEEIGELDTKQNGDKQNGEMDVEEDLISEPVPTPCITRKSLRQRNRGSHTPTPPPALTTEFKADEKKVGETSGTDEAKDKPVVAKDLFTDLTMAIKMLEGHYQDICSVDLNGEHIVSAGRDTSVKLWTTASKEELKSVGGHTATITGVKFMKDQQYATYPNAISGSYDCSVRVWDLENGTETKCIYVYSPVVCLDYSEGRVAIGTEGGKVEVYNVESGDQLFSMKSHDEAVSAVKLLADNKVACGSTDGVLKIYNISITQLEPVFVLDPLKVAIKQACGITANDNQTKSTLSMSKITCITSWKDLVIYGDEGFNLKVLDYEKGEVVKVRNNLQEFCPTESLHVTSVQGTDCLFSVGSDVDRGDAYINVRSLPDLKYFGTIRDSHCSTGSITTFCAEEIDNFIRLVTGGEQLRVWVQAPRRAKKRKSATSEECLIPCKFICNYTEARDSEPESDTDESSSASHTGTGSSTEVSQSAETPQKWCSIL